MSSTSVSGFYKHSELRFNKAEEAGITPTRMVLWTFWLHHTLRKLPGNFCSCLSMINSSVQKYSGCNLITHSWKVDTAQFLSAAVGLLHIGTDVAGWILSVYSSLRWHLHLQKVSCREVFRWLLPRSFVLMEMYGVSVIAPQFQDAAGISNGILFQHFFVSVIPRPLDGFSNRIW